MTDGGDELLLVAAWRSTPGPAAPAGWRAEPVLPDQSALDRAGSRGRTPPPFQTLLWRPAAAAGPGALTPPPELLGDLERWVVLRLHRRPAWDDTATSGVRPQVKQVSFITAQPDLAADEFARHYREHVDVARVHHPGIVRYAQHDVLDAAAGGDGDVRLGVDGVSELWFADEATLIARYYAGPDSVAVVRADNREYIDFSGTLSLLVRPVDDPGRA